jgi:diaminohydroxyphosphoribosylaminopyrimidine deaminase/5-amino-6-(5-phosphoribosylamino)uracil reductase
VEVEVGLLAEQAERLNGPFLAWHRRGRPLVTLKAASSLDGMLSAEAGESRWISGAPARRFAHRLRFCHDAVLVGAGTVRRDDPRLTVRLGEQSGSPRRVVLSASLELDPTAAIFASDAGGSHPVTVYTVNADPAMAVELEARAEVKRVAGEHGALDLEAVLRDLAHDGVQSVLVEGGGKTHGAFLEAGLAERVAIFTSGKLLGARGGTPMIDLPVAGHPDSGWRIEREQLIALGNDLVWMGRIHRGKGREGRHERVHRSD